MAVIIQHPSNINLTSPQITPSAVLIADTASFYATLDESNNYLPVQVNGLDVGVQLGAGVLPPTLTRVIRTGSNILTPFVISACLELQSTKGGFVLPRMTTAQRNALVHTNGMQIYNISTNSVDTFIGGAWVQFSAGASGNVDYVGPEPATLNGIPIFADTTGFNITDSTMTITPDSPDIAAVANAVVGNQLTNISSIDFITAGNNANDVTLGISTTTLGAQIAKIFLSTDSISSMVVSNSNVTAPSSPNAVLEIQSNTLAPACFLNSRMPTTDVTTLTAVNGMQLYDSTIGFMKTYQSGVGATGAWSTWGADGAGNIVISQSPKYGLPGSTYTGCISIGNLTGMPPIVGNFVNRVAIGNNTYCLADDSIVLGSDRATPGVANVGIGITTPLYSLHVNGGHGERYNRFAATSNPTNFNINIRDYIVFFDTTLGAVNCNLPSATGNQGQTFIINNLGANGVPGTGFTVSVTPAGSDTVNGIAWNGGSGGKYSLPQYSSMGIISDGVGGWWSWNLFINLPGSLASGVVDTATSYTALQTDYIINVTNTSSARTITLPVAPSAPEVSKIFIVKDVSGGAGTNAITVSIAGGATIDGASTAVIDSNYGSLTFFNDGANYYTIAQVAPSGGGGGVSSVSGTANRITSSGGSTPVIDISASYIGQTSITTVGTLTSLKVGGSQTVGQTGPVTGTYNVLTTDYIVKVDTTAAVSVVLRDATTNVGQVFYVKDWKGLAGTNNITITTAGGKIDGSTSYVISANYASLTVFSDGTDYYIV